MSVNTMSSRIYALDTDFERSEKAKREEHGKYQILKEKILQVLLAVVAGVLDDYTEVGRFEGDCDDNGDAIYEASYKNGECFNPYMHQFYVPFELANRLIRTFHEGIDVDGENYYIDTNNNLLYNLINNRDIVDSSSFELISSEEKKLRECSSDTCKFIQACISEMVPSLRRIGNSLKMILTSTGGPVDVGITANLIMHFAHIKARNKTSKTLDLMKILSDLQDDSKISRIVNKHTLLMNKIIRLHDQSMISKNVTMITDLLKAYPIKERKSIFKILM